MLRKSKRELAKVEPSNHRQRDSGQQLRDHGDARWVLEDPRRSPYFVFWTTEGGSLRYPLHMERIDGGEAGRVTTPTGRARRIEIVRRPSSNGTGTMILYLCPICEKPRRYLYRLAASGGRLPLWPPTSSSIAGGSWSSTSMARGPTNSWRSSSSCRNNFLTTRKLGTYINFTRRNTTSGRNVV